MSSENTVINNNIVISNTNTREGGSTSLKRPYYNKLVSMSKKNSVRIPEMIDLIMNKYISGNYHIRPNGYRQNSEVDVVSVYVRTDTHRQLKKMRDVFHAPMSSILEAIIDAVSDYTADDLNLVVDNKVRACNDTTDLNSVVDDKVPACNDTTKSDMCENTSTSISINEVINSIKLSLENTNKLISILEKQINK